MSYTFSTKTWSISGEHDFDGFSLLNPTFSIKNVQFINDRIYVQLEISENGGVYKHHTSINCEAKDETDINLLVDDIMAEKFPTAVSVA